LIETSHANEPVTDLTPILDHVPAWLMVLFRLTGIFILAPVFGSASIPRQVKVFFAVALAFLIYPMLLTPGKPSAALIGDVIANGLYLWELIGRIAVELLIGFTIGYAASLPLIAMQMGGQMIDQQMGLAFAGVINPEFNEEAGIVGQLMFLAALAIFIIVGGHRQILATLIGSFDHVPLGSFVGFDGLVTLIVGLLQVMFELTLRVAAPVLCVMFLLMVAMGFIARTVPQMNILSVGFVIRILVGALFLLLSAAIALALFAPTAGRMLGEIHRFFVPG
jgi:flagellar biosynthetic protein FliR